MCDKHNTNTRAVYDKQLACMPNIIYEWDVKQQLGKATTFSHDAIWNIEKTSEHQESFDMASMTKQKQAFTSKTLNQLPRIIASIKAGQEADIKHNKSGLYDQNTQWTSTAFYYKTRETITNIIKWIRLKQIKSSWYDLAATTLTSRFTNTKAWYQLKQNKKQLTQSCAP